MSNLSDLLPAGAGAKSATFTANGTIASGKTLILETAGTVTQVARDSASQSVGSPAVYETATTQYSSCAYDANAGKIVVAYYSSSSNGTAVVGTVSGTSISFGTPVTFTSNGVSAVSVVYDTNAQKILIVYKDGPTGHGKGVVGTVSGTSISFGSIATFASDTTSSISAAYDENAQKTVIVFEDEGNLDYLTAVVATVSGTSVSFGSEVVAHNASVSFTSIAYDSNAQKVVVAYRNHDNSYYGTAKVGTVSGTSTSWGSPVVFESAFIEYTATAYDSNANKSVIACRDEGNSSYGTAIVGTVSGTSISFGTAVVFETAMTNWITMSYDVNAKKVAIGYSDVGNSSQGTVIAGQVSGTSITFDTAEVFETGSTTEIGSTYDSGQQKVVLAYRDGGNSSYGTGVVFQAAYDNTNLTATNFVGISDEAIADTATGSVVVEGGVTEKVSGLTTGSTYYIQNDGTLSTTTSSVTAGKALSATKLLLKG